MHRKEACPFFAIAGTAREALYFGTFKHPIAAARGHYGDSCACSTNTLGLNNCGLEALALFWGLLQKNQALNNVYQRQGQMPLQCKVGQLTPFKTGAWVYFPAGRHITVAGKKAYWVVLHQGRK